MATIDTQTMSGADKPRPGGPAWVRPFLPPAGTGPRWWRLLRWPVALLFGLFGLLVAVSAVTLHLLGAASEAWPTTTGRVIEATVEVHRPTATDRSPRDSRSARPRYMPRVRYAYAVDGRTYEGEEIALEPTTYQARDDAAAVVARYPVGDPVTVYYDPARPERAVLAPGWDRSDTLWGLVVGMGSVGGGLLLLRFGHVRPLQPRRR